ncbi:hypothetical protein NYE24_00670 [Paenibacillus sp. FSL H7-0350]|uniref:hypothetical protein n=1 Tax=Paenibacillus sp. FSL H7-0350 TaxID=2975345 RepID=UPI00315833F5
MNKCGIILISSIMFCLLAGCSNSDQTSEVALSNQSENVLVTNDMSTKASTIDVKLDISTDISPENTVTVSGKTNLPSGMELMLALKNTSNNYSAQEKTIVLNGSFTSSSFSDNGNGLKKGAYSLEVTSPTANVQPYHVKELIGENGVNLEGNIVISDPTWGSTILTTKEVAINSDVKVTSNESSETSSTYNKITEQELVTDPRAPSTNPNDYNSDGQYVPENGISDNPEDYNFDGDYKPIDEMTQEEIQAELEEMLGRSLGE